MFLSTHSSAAGVKEGDGGGGGGEGVLSKSGHVEAVKLAAEI